MDCGRQASGDNGEVFCTFSVKDMGSEMCSNYHLTTLSLTERVQQFHGRVSVWTACQGCCEMFYIFISQLSLTCLTATFSTDFRCDRILKYLGFSGRQTGL